MEVEGAGHLRELLLKGEDSKRRAATAMNHRSSRAHCLLMLSLSQNANQFADKDKDTAGNRHGRRPNGTLVEPKSLEKGNGERGIWKGAGV